MTFVSCKELSTANLFVVPNPRDANDSTCVWTKATIRTMPDDIFAVGTTCLTSNLVATKPAT